MTVPPSVTFRVAALLALAGCVEVGNPCPEGWRLNYHKQICVRLPTPDAGAPADVGQSPIVDSGMDAAPPAPGIGDAEVTLDGAMLDASMDSSTEKDASPDASDGSIDASDGSTDAARDSGGIEPPLSCSPEDEGNWRAFHLSGQLIQSIGACFAGNPSCAKGPCPLDDCLRDKAEVSACNECVTAEVECMVAKCTRDCGANDTNDTCRACACAKGCVAAFDNCAPERLDVCADCDETTCGNLSVLAPELIMVVIDSNLY
ncbi:MAG: hypothetical protein QM778_37190 [Myxococcales bacterium]